MPPQPVTELIGKYKWIGAHDIKLRLTRRTCIPTHHLSMDGPVLSTKGRHHLFQRPRKPQLCLSSADIQDPSQLLFMYQLIIVVIKIYDRGIVPAFDDPVSPIRDPAGRGRHILLCHGWQGAQPKNKPCDQCCYYFFHTPKLTRRQALRQQNRRTLPHRIYTNRGASSGSSVFAQRLSSTISATLAP